MRIKKQLNACVLAVSLLGMPWVAEAAGLGRLNVLSGLGQPFRAEIELLSVAPEELSALRVNLASIDAFRENQIEYASQLNGLKFVVEQRGVQAVLKIQSNTPMNDPFVDMLIELNWPSGRLVKQYTALLDPAEASTPKRGSSVDLPSAEVGKRHSDSPVRGKNLGEMKLQKRHGKKAKAASSAAEDAAPSSSPAEKAAPASNETNKDKYTVKTGDTLNKVARQFQPEGINLDQMLLGLYKQNQDAFLNRNINKLRNGAELTIPAKKELESISPTDAQKELRAHSKNWGAYRENVANAVVDSAAKPAQKQTSTGKIAVKTDDKAKPEGQAPKDVVKLSRGETNAKAGTPAGDAALAKKRLQAVEEENAARAKQVQEQQERIKQLEKNVNDLSALNKLKNEKFLQAQRAAEETAKAKKEQELKAKQTAAEKQKQDAEAKAKQLAQDKANQEAKAKQAADEAAAKKEAEHQAKLQAEAAAKQAQLDKAKQEAEAKAAAELQAKQEAQKKAGTKVESVPQPGSEASKPAENKAADVAKPVTEAAAKPVKKPKPPVPATPVEEESGPFAFILDNIPLLGGGLALALLGGAGLAYMAKRRRKPSFEDSILTGGDLKSNTVLGTTGGGVINTNSLTENSFLTDFSREGLGAIDTDEVDPIAEAEVYMAYGRDPQAEEILKDALAKDGSRHELRLKLLEIYANRKNNAQFEGMATELYSLVNGQGPHWAKAAEMGKALDPNNPLYQQNGPASAAAAAAPVLDDLTQTFALNPAPVAPSATLDAADSGALASLSALEESLDFDLGEPQAEPAPEAHALDFDLGSFSAAEPVVVEAAPALGEVDFSLDEPAAAVDTGVLNFELPSEEPAAEVASSVAAADLGVEAEDQILNFDFDLSGMLAEPAAAPAPAPAPDLAKSSLNFKDLNLDLEQAPPAAVDAPAAIDFGSEESLDFNLDGFEPDQAVDDADPVATKIDLAHAYIGMGDKEGAREILQEVMNEGSDEQRAKATELLALI